jgi:hypothetical protein
MWAIALGGLLSLLLLPMNENSSIFTTNYTLSADAGDALGRDAFWL